MYVSGKRGCNNDKIFKQENSIEMLNIFGLIENISKYNILS